MNKKALMLTGAIISAVLLSACNADNADSAVSSGADNESKAFSQFTRAESESSTPEAIRTVSDVPTGVLSDDDEFLKGIWVDEKGFVACFSDSGRAAIFDSGALYESDTAAKDVTITAQDADTITITADGTSYTAYHADSAKGAELAESFVESAEGEWALFSYGFEQIFEIKKYSLLMSFSTDLSGEIITLGLDGVALRMSLLSDTNVYARLDNDKLSLYSVYDSSIFSFELMKRDSEEYKKLSDAGTALLGTWVYPDATENTITFANDGTSLEITGDAFSAILGDKFGAVPGRTYQISAKYEDGIINVSSDGKTLFYAEAYDDETITVFTDTEEPDYIELYREDSYMINNAKETEKLEAEKADLLDAYPDDDRWLRNTDFGDILSLAEKEYIDKYAPGGYFLAGTPQELASFVYYVNTQPLEQGQVALELTADIDLSGYKWAPMGWSGYEDHPFAFCVYGKGHTIKNLTINTSDSNIGFIGWGTVCGVSNLNIENADIKGSSNVGVITGQAIMGNYENCYASGSVTGYSAGSMLGYEASCSISGCSADVTVNGQKFDFISWNEQQKSEIEIEDPVTITIDEDYTVTRPEVEGYFNLGWMVFMDGEEVLHRNAEGELSYRYFGNEPGHSYKIYLSAYVQGQYVPISNIIEYTVE